MEEDNIATSNENSNKMTTLELVTYHFKELGFENENPEDLQMVADLHERWLNKDKRELTEREYVILKSFLSKKASVDDQNRFFNGLPPAFWIASFSPS